MQVNVSLSESKPFNPVRLKNIIGWQADSNELNDYDIT